MADNQVPQILLGILLLGFGKKLFWLFVGIIGFMTGMDLGSKLLPGYSELFVFAIALALGSVGAVLAVAFQWVAIIASGFLAGGFLLFKFFPTDSYATFLMGGIMGALLMGVVFDRALLILSSLVGATLVSQELSLSESTRIFMFIVLVAVGITVQSTVLLGRPKG